MKDTHPSALQDEINPYAPPSAESPASPEEKYSWYTAMRAVYVKDEGVLPAVDLAGASAETPLVRTTRTISKSTPTGTMVTVIIFGIVGFFSNRWMDHLPYLLLTIFLASYLLKFIFHFVCPELWMKRVKFTLHCTASLERFQKAMIVSRIIAAGICFAPVFIVPAKSGLMTLIAGIVVFRIINYGLKKFALRRYPLEMHFSEGQPGWLRLFPVHPDALDRLRKIEAERERE